VNRLTNYFSKIQKIEKSDSNSEQDINVPTTNTLCDCDSVVSSAVPTSASDSEKQEHAADGENTSNTNLNFPAVWSDQQWLERKEKHKWLIAKNEHLGCSDCSQVGHLGLYKTQGLLPSSEWTNCTVTLMVQKQSSN
jgi:hypothetical protein